MMTIMTTTTKMMTNVIIRTAAVSAVGDGDVMDVIDFQQVHSPPSPGTEVKQVSLCVNAVALTSVSPVAVVGSAGAGEEEVARAQPGRLVQGHVAQP